MRTSLILYALALSMVLVGSASGQLYDRTGAWSGALSAEAVAGTGEGRAFYNPAAVAFASGQALSLSSGVDFLAASFAGRSPYPGYGREEVSSANNVQLPGVSYFRVFGPRFAVVFSGFSPFELQRAWEAPATFSGRFLAVNTLLRSYLFSGSFVWKVRDRLAVSVGAGGVFGSLAHDRILPVVLNGSVYSAGLMKLSGTAFGAPGAVLALAFRYDERTKIGIAWRSRQELGITEGRAEVSVIRSNEATVIEVAESALPPSQTFATRLIIPAQVRVGLQRELAPGRSLSLAAALFFSGSGDNFRYNFSSSLPEMNLGNASRNRLELNAVFQQVLSDRVRLGLGYMLVRHEDDPAAYNPVWIPEGEHEIAAAVAYSTGTVHLTLAGRWRSFKKAETTGENTLGLEGVYESGSAGLSLSVAYTFGAGETRKEK